MKTSRIMPPVVAALGILALFSALFAGPALAESASPSGVTPLMRAAAAALTDDTDRELLSRATAAEISAQDSQGRTALAYALSEAPDMLAQSAVQDLLARGAVPGTGEAPFPLQAARLAVSRRGAEISGLLSAKVRVDEKLPNGFTAFLWAAAFAPPEALHALVQAGADPKQSLPEQDMGNGEKKPGDNAVVIAAESNSGPAMRVLLGMGLDANSVSCFITAHPGLQES